jgi:hypothetical protein
MSRPALRNIQPPVQQIPAFLPRSKAVVMWS